MKIAEIKFDHQESANFRFAKKANRNSVAKMTANDKNVKRASQVGAKFEINTLLNKLGKYVLLQHWNKIRALNKKNFSIVICPRPISMSCRFRKNWISEYRDIAKFADTLLHYLPEACFLRRRFEYCNNIYQKQYLRCKY